ncbi:ribokinase [Nesidiocoris tenuis]|uniref:Ribokinase n=1 Tax=Nesidiocoris tenuis TaxID=355587 RepID=A0ABN7AQ31_9HEMI|nr:ribokinase [Nesidiocoris tenuis]
MSGSPNVDVAVIGSCMIDMICYTPRIPTPGETLCGTSFELGNGGKGANQCVAAAKLGARCALVAALGNDVFGLKYLEHLKGAGIDVKHVKLSEERHSGIAQITVTENGENCIVIVPGSNSLLCMEDVKRADDVLLKSKVVVFQLETPVTTTVQALKYLKSKGKCTTILNAAPASSELPLEAYILSDIFCVNEIEAGQLAGHIVTDFDSAKKAVAFFKSVGCKTVIITLGEKGIVYSDSTGNPVHLPVRKITPVDSTGAGDAFVGALAYYISRQPDLPFKDQIQRSAHIATESVLNRGTQSSYPTKEQLPKELFDS